MHVPETPWWLFSHAYMIQSPNTVCFSPAIFIIGLWPNIALAHMKILNNTLILWLLNIQQQNLH